MIRAANDQEPATKRIEEDLNLKNWPAIVKKINGTWNSNLCWEMLTFFKKSSEDVKRNSDTVFRSEIDSINTTITWRTFLSKNN